VIADSLGGVSNAYNITPQNSALNRHGDQAYMEKWIRDAGGCTNFEAIITYPNTQTQIPSKYKFTYT
jgi:DNA/RNA endonuclease G (NUC1)